MLRSVKPLTGEEISSISELTKEELLVKLNNAGYEREGFWSDGTCYELS